MSAVTVGVPYPRKGWFGRPHGECRFKPLHDRVLIKRIDADKKTSGGPIIPDRAREKPQQGEVIAVGLGMRASSGKRRPLSVRPGDRILIGKWAETAVKIHGQDLLVLKESDILGVIEDVQVSSKAA
jgi:chaperonin GroES